MEPTSDANANMCNCHGDRNCVCPHHKAIPVFIILIGLAFLLQGWDLLSESTVAIVWPVLLIAIGGTQLFKRVCKCC